MYGMDSVSKLTRRSFSTALMAAPWIARAPVEKVTMWRFERSLLTESRPPQEMLASSGCGATTRVGPGASFEPRPTRVIGMADTAISIVSSLLAAS